MQPTKALQPPAKSLACSRLSLSLFFTRLQLQRAWNRLAKARPGISSFDWPAIQQVRDCVASDFVTPIASQVNSYTIDQDTKRRESYVSILPSYDKRKDKPMTITPQREMAIVQTKMSKRGFNKFDKPVAII